MEDFVNKLWYPTSKVTLGFALLKYLLLPLSLVFALVSALRRSLFKLGLKQTVSLDVPVIIVGNITVGGSGKTPTVIYLIELLRQHGFTPGVISRGYGVKFDGVKLVKASMSAAEVGDEPAMIVARTSVSMAIGADRVEAARVLLEGSNVDIIISDDGLQHYRLKRDIELLILDGERRLGNGCLLPAGPLREGAWRQSNVDFILVNGKAHAGEYQMELVPSSLKGVNTSIDNSFDPAFNLSGFDKSSKVAAVAGIGNPQRFFNTLAGQGFNVAKFCTYADHQAFTLAGILSRVGNLPVIMTEKDAVKCRGFAKDNWWYLPVNAKLAEEFDRQLISKIRDVVAEKQGNKDGV